MSLSSVWRTLIRRWYVTLLGLLLTLGLVYAGAKLSPPTYQARASVLLIPPKSQQEANPYLGLGGLQEVSDVLSRAVSDSVTTDAVTAAGGSAKYSVARDTSTTGPIILVTAEAPSAATALLTDKLLIQRMGPALTSLQAGQDVPAGAYINLITLSADQKAAVQRKSQLRACIAGGAAGLLLTVLLVAFAEKTANRRRGRRSAAAVAAGDAPNPAGRTRGRRHKGEHSLADETVPAEQGVADDSLVDEHDELIDQDDAPESGTGRRPAASGGRSRTHG
ncbi:MAG TPA: hypothetical protein VMB79_08185 [Jatrophihabitans sp.]|nr:hypothetical protein [Jatrophihabitans sp.]